jgi:hypothetical protein
MASRDDVYLKFGLTAEAAQLFETDLGTVLLGLVGESKGWHLNPNPTEAAEFYEGFNRKTLGQILGDVKRRVQLEPKYAVAFESALGARNRLNHGFFERHNYAIASDEGRQRMWDDLERLHQELFEAWQLVQHVRDEILDRMRATGAEKAR